MLMIMGALFLLFCSVPSLSRGGLVYPQCAGRRGLGKYFALMLAVVPICIWGGILVGFRPLDAGFDTPHYVRAYLSLDSFWNAREVGQSIYGNTELLWWPLQSLVTPLLGARAWLVTNYIVAFVLVFLAYHSLCKKLQVNVLVFAFVFMTYYLVYSGNAMRQVLSLPLGLMALCCFMERRYFVFGILVSLAIGLHWSAIFYLAIPLLALPLLRKQWALLAVPVVFLGLSFFIKDLAGFFINLANLPALTVKYELYFLSGRESHVGMVWKTVNFWICVLISMAFLVVCKPELYKTHVLHLYVMFILSLVLFGVYIPDFSERFFPALLLVLPVMIVLLIRRFKFTALSGELIFLSFFMLLWVLVFFSHSARETLVYNIY